MRVARRERKTEFHFSGVHDVLARVYAHRGVAAAGELDLGLQSLVAPASLPDIDKAAERIARAVQSGEPILIVGDFDADGATSVALCMLVLRDFGAEQVDFLVPNRFEYGYGLSPEIVALVRDQPPAVLITVDNGVSSVEGVAAANELGIDVVITDHHLPGNERPAAFALVNPNVPESDFASRALAGVGVAYYVLSVVRRKLEAAHWFERRTMPNLANYLDLVALGTVADVVPLDVNNRRLVHHGLQRIRAGRCRPGIKALAEIGKRSLPKLLASDLGFAIGPRLNAAGRLDDMTVGIKCLLAEELGEARRLATSLDQLNRARQSLESEMVADAELLLAIAEEQSTEVEGGEDVGPATRFGVAVYHENFHQGVVGIVAGRLRERINRPAIVFADAGGDHPDELKGSARSIEGLHIRDALDRIATRNPGLVVKFGGHAMAAGLSIKRVHFKRFQKIFDKTVAELVDPEALEAVILSDGALVPEEMTVETANLLAHGGPWGAGFAPPVFDGSFQLVSQRVVGEQHLKMVLKIEGRVIDAIAFRQAPLPQDTREVEVVYQLTVNDFGEWPTAQLIVEYVRPLA